MGFAGWGAPAAVSAAAIVTLLMAAISPANAADKLIMAPPDTWVVPVAVPDNAGEASSAPVKVLLRDEQYDLQPGKLTRYSESVFKVQTPQGLSIGAVNFTWNPDTQMAIVHKLEIQRGTKRIDV